VGVAPEGVDGAHAHDGAAGQQQRQQQGNGAGVPVLAEDAQPLQPLLTPPLQQRDAQIALGGHVGTGGGEAVDLIEGITEKLLRQLPGQHVGIQGQLVGGFGKGQAVVRHGAIQVGAS
jgi:hypothetical protein